MLKCEKFDYLCLKKVLPLYLYQHADQKYAALRLFWLLVFYSSLLGSGFGGLGGLGGLSGLNGLAGDSQNQIGGFLQPSFTVVSSPVVRNTVETQTFAQELKITFR